MERLHFPREQTIRIPLKRFANVVDESLMQRIEERRERLQLAGIEVKPVMHPRRLMARAAL